MALESFDTTAIRHRLFKPSGIHDYNDLVLQIFRHQVENVSVFGEFCQRIGRVPESVNDIEDLPFLPISFFKSHQVMARGHEAQTTFLSSGTTGSMASRHHVADLSLYEDSFLSAFEQAYGAVSDWCILALLPSYLEREGSSLVYMADRLIQRSGHAESGFYLHDLNQLKARLSELEKQRQKTLLLGVSYALLDLADQMDFPLRSTLVMETGGMKGKRREMTKPELHGHLQAGFGVSAIHSEYGMTELLSQAYSPGGGRFYPPPWMKVVIRDATDPLQLAKPGSSGGINVIDLANLHSCAFIATQDLGRVYPDGSFEVLGRFDHSDLRGCNLLVG